MIGRAFREIYTMGNGFDLTRIPATFGIVSEKLDFQDNSGANYYDESKVGLACKGDPVMKDRFELDGQWLPEGYEIDIWIRSDSQVGIYNDGHIELTYTEATKGWRIEGFKIDGDEWKFHSVEGVVDTMIAGISCLANDRQDPEGYGFILKHLSRSLVEGRANIIATYRRNSRRISQIEKSDQTSGEHVLASAKKAFSAFFHPWI